MTFLEQLQQSAGLLGQQIQNVEPFGVYTPTESDYIQGVAQNKWSGNQFQMPNLGQSVHGGTQYTGMGTGVGTGMGTGTYTPGVFGSHYQSETGIPVGVTYPNGLINQGQGGGRDRDVNPTAYNFPNYNMIPGILGLIKGISDMPQGTKFKWNSETEQYEPVSFVNQPEDVESWNVDQSTMTMDQQGNVTFGRDPYGIGDYSGLDNTAGPSQDDSALGKDSGSQGQGFGGPSGHGSGMQGGQHGPTGGMGGHVSGTARF